MTFTEQEKTKLADGILLLIESETSAMKFTGCQKAREAIEDEISELQELLHKLFSEEVM